MERSEKRAEDVAKKGMERARRAKETALDFAIGGPAVAAEAAAEALDRVAERGEKAAREGIREVRSRAAEATAETRKKVEGAGPPDTRAYEDRTRDELYALAVERDISGRSTMRKAELIEALRASA